MTEAETTTRSRVLVIDDEPNIRDLVQAALRFHGFEVITAASGGEGLALARSERPDLILLDWMLPLISGLEVCRQLRRKPATRDVPIIMVTARGEEADRIRGLEGGADDYVTKPFSLSELMARVQARIRRSHRGQAISDSVPLSYGPFTLYRDSQLVYKQHIPIPLSEKETELLYALMTRPNQAIGKMELFELVWGHHRFSENSLNVYINHLRRKIEDDPRLPRYIQTVWGLGYRFTLHDPNDANR